jgi:hypothetical protein
MAPNVRTGLKRLAIVYFSVCILCGLYGWYLQSVATDGFLKASEANANPDMAYRSGLSSTGIDFIEGAFLFGIILPIVAATVGFIGRWIHRGFKPKTQ